MEARQLWAASSAREWQVLAGKAPLCLPFVNSAQKAWNTARLFCAFDVPIRGAIANVPNGAWVEGIQ